MRVALRLVLWVGIGLAWAAAPARSQSPPAVAVDVDGCVPVDHDKLRTLLAIELGAATVSAAADGSATHVRVGCTAQGIELRLEDPVTGKQMARTLPAASFTDASSTRLLALAVAEFVVASWIELSVQPKPVVEPVGPRADPALQRTARDVVAQKVKVEPKAALDGSISAGPALQLWTSHDAILLGAGLRVLLPLAPAIAWTISGDVAFARAEVAVGALDVMTGSVALALALHLRAGALAFQIGPGGRFGVAHMAGDPDPGRAEGHTVIAPYGGVIWLTRAELRASARLRVGLEIEAGFATLPVRGELNDDRTVLALEGLWATALAGVGFAF